MINYEDILQLAPFAVQQKEKEKLFLKRLIYLSHFHEAHCEEYQRVIEHLNIDLNHFGVAFTNW